MTTANIFTVIRDVQVALGHKSETKTRQKIKNHYWNVSVMTVRLLITQFERCAKKAKKSARCGRSADLCVFVERPWLRNE